MNERERRRIEDEPAADARAREDTPAARTPVAPLIDLQRSAGNRAVSNLIARGRKPRTEEGKKQVEEGKKKLQALHARQRDSTAVSKVIIERVVGNTFRSYARLSAAKAAEQCEAAASRIGSALKNIAHRQDVEYFCVCSWEEPDNPDAPSMNHWVVIVGNDTVVDATGHQFDGGEARIVDYSTWFSDLKQRIGPTTLAKYARGSWSDCTDVSAAATFWTAPGTPLHAYDAKLLKRPGD